MLNKMLVLITGLGLISFISCAQSTLTTTTTPLTVSPTNTQAPTTIQAPTTSVPANTDPTRVIAPSTSPATTVSVTATTTSPPTTATLSPTTITATTVPATNTTPTSTMDITPIQIPDSGVKAIGDLRVWIVTDPAAPIRGYTVFKTFLLDSKDQPVSDAKVTYSFNMTNMNMGEYALTPTLFGEGRYSAKVFLSMVGPWRVIITVDRGGQTNKVQFDFQAVPAS